MGHVFKHLKEDHSSWCDCADCMKIELANRATFTAEQNQKLEAQVKRLQDELAAARVGKGVHDPELKDWMQQLARDVKYALKGLAEMKSDISALKSDSIAALSPVWEKELMDERSERDEAERAFMAEYDKVALLSAENAKLRKELGDMPGNRALSDRNNQLREENAKLHQELADKAEMCTRMSKAIFGIDVDKLSPAVEDAHKLMSVPPSPPDSLAHARRFGTFIVTGIDKDAGTIQISDSKQATCKKCNAVNEYVDPDPNYTCYSCRQ